MVHCIAPSPAAYAVANFSHAELCEFAVRWLKRPHARGGHGCSVAATIESPVTLAPDLSAEPKACDVIGFRSAGYWDGSVAVICAATRRDFLDDIGRPERYGAGVGTWRYYLVPEDVALPNEAPPAWGMLQISRRGVITPLRGAATSLGQRFDDEVSGLTQWRQSPDHLREVQLFARVLARADGFAAAERLLRESVAAQEHLRAEISSLRIELARTARESAPAAPAPRHLRTA